MPESQRLIRARCIHPTGTWLPFPAEAMAHSIPERFEQQVREHATRLAVQADDNALSYAQLNEQVNRLAWAIHAQLGTTTQRVAVLFEHGLPSITALLAVLKSGHIYVPLDPGFPAERWRAILQDAQAALCLTSSRYAGALPDVRCLDVDALPPGLPTTNLGLTIAPDALAYIMYTSGSTGQPKGVMQTQRNRLQGIMQYSNDYHICPDDHVTNLHPPGFSSSPLDMLGALLNGASLHPFDAKTRDLSQLPGWIEQHGITLLSWVTTPFRRLCALLPDGHLFRSLRLISLGSEAVTREDVELYRRHSGADCIFAVRYGSGESLNIRVYFMDKHSPLPERVVPSGYAMPDKDVLIVNELGETLGAGAVGEIAVRSRYLSPGYWRRPDLTQAAFAATDDPAVRVYRTGDLGCLLPDGCLMHLGRTAQHVRLRGMSVDLFEIESALRQYPTLREVAVVVQPGVDGEEQLVAYVAGDTAGVPGASALRAFLRTKLPDHMLPSVFVPLPALPLTASGKLDRNALRALTPARAHTPPRIPLEQQLCQWWAEVLDAGAVGLDDDFFALGGDSLRATLLVNRLQTLLDVALPVGMLFDAPTVRELLAYLRRHHAQALEPGQAGPSARIAAVAREPFRMSVPPRTP